MAGKTSGSSRKNATSKKSSSRQKTVTPIDQSNGASQQQVAAAQLNPEIEEEIRCRAYELYEQRGRQEGFHLEDWTRAETEVLSRYRREKSA